MDEIIYTTENLYQKNKVKNSILYLSILFLVIIIIILLPIIKVDISSQSRGVVRSKNENVSLTPVVSGKIIYINKNLQNNGYVKKGDTLLILDTQSLEAQSIKNQSLEKDFINLLSDLNKLTSGNYSNFSTGEMLRDYQSYKQKRQESLATLNQAKRTYDRQKYLYDRGAISTVEFEKADYDYKASQESLKSIDEQQKAAWETRRREVEQQLKNYQGTIDEINANKKNYYIMAPISGTIINYSGGQIGAYINASQAIAEISSNNNLLVECYVSPSDIGLLKKNQDVLFQIDAYNYNQWGLLKGKVVDIDKNITMDNSGSYFKVRCMMNKKYLTLKNGYKGNITKGMTLTARFYINKRSLWNLLYDKVDDWINPNIITTNQEKQS